MRKTSVRIENVVSKKKTLMMVTVSAQSPIVYASRRKQTVDLIEGEAGP